MAKELCKLHWKAVQNMALQGGQGGVVPKSKLSLRLPICLSSCSRTASMEIRASDGRNIQSKDSGLDSTRI